MTRPGPPNENLPTVSIVMITIVSGNKIGLLVLCVCRETYPMLLAANKVDLVHARGVSEDAGRELARALNAPYIETSAKEPPLNIDAAFHELVRIIRKHPQQEEKQRRRRKFGKCALL
ncbi:unnamed protein product [Chrysodeixis includens]|uniref:small monomeric GTPase n=1 Tax=Chrysodeixis includens TaxID=689277 RepID=A0A9N8KXF6_CHRIL|nr:unnamed protein product [Chrysodeixis includens]